MSTKSFEFSKALEELEQITAWFESSEVDLDQGLTKFERGMELSAELKQHLQTVENRVEKIKQRFTEAPAKPAAGPTPPHSLDDLDDLPESDDQAGLF